jgi:hypothetical protein
MTMPSIRSLTTPPVTEHGTAGQKGCRVECVRRHHVADAAPRWPAPPSVEHAAGTTAGEAVGPGDAVWPGGEVMAVGAGLGLAVANGGGDVAGPAQAPIRATRHAALRAIRRIADLIDTNRPIDAREPLL